MRRIKDDARRYVLAVLAAVVALLLREMFAPFLGKHNPYHTIWAAVVFAAWYCGVGPAVVTTLMGALGIWYWFLPPFHFFGLQDPKSEIAGLVGFVVLSGFIIVLGEANRRTKLKLIEARDGLETRVRNEPLTSGEPKKPQEGLAGES